MSAPEGPMSPPPARMSIGTMVLMGAGIMLLFPGACSLFFLVAFIAEKPSSPFSDPYAQIFLPVMFVCLLVSAGGVWMIVAARRRRRRAP